METFGYGREVVAVAVAVVAIGDGGAAWRTHSLESECVRLKLSIGRM